MRESAQTGVEPSHILKARPGMGSWGQAGLGSAAESGVVSVVAHEVLMIAGTIFFWGHASHRKSLLVKR